MISQPPSGKVLVEFLPLPLHQSLYILHLQYPCDLLHPVDFYLFKSLSHLHGSPLQYPKGPLPARLTLFPGNQAHHCQSDWSQTKAGSSQVHITQFTLASQPSVISSPATYFILVSRASVLLGSPHSCCFLLLGVSTFCCPSPFI